MSTSALRPVDELIWSMPFIAEAATNDWAKNFALSIMRQSRRRNWTPSPKQHALMNRMVAEHYHSRGDFDAADDMEVIE